LRICVDTTYILPFMGVEIERLPPDILTRLIDGGYEVLINEITLFEGYAKASKLSARGLLKPERIHRGLIGILHTPSLKRIDLIHPETLRFAAILRRYLDDFIDCILLSTATLWADILLTEDQILLKPPPEVEGRIRAINPTLRIRNYQSLQKESI